MTLSKTSLILMSRLKMLSAHFSALSDYHSLINDILTHKNLYHLEVFTQLSIQEKAFLDAYLKRFSSMQDFLGAKVFPVLLESAGIPQSSMSETLSFIEKEGIIDDLSHWIELRQTRNELEHDYPEKLEEALINLKFCIDSYATLQGYYERTLQFTQQHTNETL